MKIIDIKKTGLEKSVELAQKVIQDNGIVIYPTDTIYGLAGNILEKTVYDRIMEIKQRYLTKAVSWQISEFSFINKYTDFLQLPEKSKIKTFCETIFPGPITLVLPINKELLPDHLKDFSSIGFRIPDHPFCNKLSSALSFPLTTTSANISEQPYSDDINDIIDFFKDKISHFFIDESKKVSLPSTVIQIDENGLNLIREGAVKMDKIMQIWNDKY